MSFLGGVATFSTSHHYKLQQQPQPQQEQEQQHHQQQQHLIILWHSKSPKTHQLNFPQNAKVHFSAQFLPSHRGSSPSAVFFNDPRTRRCCSSSSPNICVLRQTFCGSVGVFRHIYAEKRPKLQRLFLFSFHLWSSEPSNIKDVWNLNGLLVDQISFFNCQDCIACKWLRLQALLLDFVGVLSWLSSFAFNRLLGVVLSILQHGNAW